MKYALEIQPNLDLKQDTVVRLLTQQDADGRASIHGVVTSRGWTIAARTIILTTGTFINGRLVVGDRTQAGGRSGEAPALGISESLRALGLTIGRFKTGTPPRIDARTVDFSQATVQPGSASPLYFSAMSPHATMSRCHLAHQTRSIRFLTRRGQPGDHSYPATWSIPMSARMTSSAPISTAPRSSMALSRGSVRATAHRSKTRSCDSPTKNATRYFWSLRDGALARSMCRG